MELVLGIETSGTATGIALLRAGEVVHEADETGTAHNRVLLRLVEGALAAAGSDVAGLTGIGVTIGPGMFTSLRVGLGTAKGLALPHDIPLKGVSSLHALARTAAEPGSPVLAVIDARKRQVYAALYRDDELLLGPGVFDPGELADRLAQHGDSGLLVAGDVDALRPALGRMRPSGVTRPAARVVARIAARELARGRADDIETLEPVYLRRTDAELSREKRD